MREIIFDTETTGLDPATGHRIVEIGCVEVIGKVPTGERFHRYINPERDVPPEAQAVHGLTREFLSSHPVFSEVAEAFLDFLGESPLVIHNAGFDMKFINAELGRLGFSPFPATRAVDTMTLARKKFPGAPASLDALCRRFSIDLSGRTKHGALLDAELLAEVYLELCGGRQAMMDLAPTVIKPAMREQADAPALSIQKRVFPLTDAEKEAHRAFVATLKSPLWEALETAEA